MKLSMLSIERSGSEYRGKVLSVKKAPKHRRITSSERAGSQCECE